MRLDDLVPILGGHICRAEHTWLETEVGGLRSCIIRRSDDDGAGAGTFELAVFTPQARNLDPFFPRQPGDEWRLAAEPLELPRLNAGVVFTGCRRGVLFATVTTPPSVEVLVGALWELVGWAREPWRPPDLEQHESERWRHLRRNQWLIVSAVVLIVVLVAWLSSTTCSIVALIAAVCAHVGAHGSVRAGVQCPN